MAKQQEIAVQTNEAPLAPAQVSESAALVQMIDRAARDQTVDVNKMRELLAMRKEIAGEIAQREFNAAMTAAQTEMRPVVADASNPQTKSKYASYLALDKALRPIYTTHGFALSFNTVPGAGENMTRVVCDVSHSAGYSKRYEIDMPSDGVGAKGGAVMSKTHATGSAVSYGMRYLLKMIFNVAVGEDDDGNGASVTPISEQQAAHLNTTCDEIGADKRAFCEYFGIDGIPMLPATKYQRAIALLEKKRAKEAQPKDEQAKEKEPAQ